MFVVEELLWPIDHQMLTSLRWTLRGRLLSAVDVHKKYRNKEKQDVKEDKEWDRQRERQRDREKNDELWWETIEKSKQISVQVKTEDQTKQVWMWRREDPGNEISWTAVTTIQAGWTGCQWRDRWQIRDSVDLLRVMNGLLGEQTVCALITGVTH